MNYLLNLNIFEISILIAFSISFLIQLFYYLFFYLRIRFYKEKEVQVKQQFPVSVIICAKNEGDYLREFLPGILSQNYPDYEVIVVNDGSNDDTEDVLKLYKGKYPKLYVTTLPSTGKFKHSKKLAVSIGLKAAKNDWVLMIDADCKIVSENWIAKMQEKFEDKADFVLGYGGYMSAKGFLNRMIRFDTLFIAMQYFTFAMAKLPYMGVGRNLAYRKELFFKNKGFSRHLHLASGDDDLFVNDNANGKNVRIKLDPESFTLSVAEKKFKSWFYQKKRHLTTGKYYRFKHKLALGFELLSRLLFFTTFIAGMFYPNIFIILILGFLVRYIIQLTILYFASIKLKEKGIFYLGIIFDFVIPIINFMVHLSNIKIRKREK
jgi:poly-beta-1,6-N-acetyl-D-glucosamine synthase